MFKHTTCLNKCAVPTNRVPLTVVRCIAVMAFHGMACLVAGGAKGLGRATVKRLLQQGCKVVIADLPSSGGDIVANEFGEACYFSPTDVRFMGTWVGVGGGGGGGEGG